MREYVLPTNQFVWSPFTQVLTTTKHVRDKPAHASLVSFTAQQVLNPESPIADEERAKAFLVQKLAHPLFQIYQECSNSFSQIAYNTDTLSRFLSLLIKHHLPEINHYLSLFERFHYSTPIKLSLLKRGPEINSAIHAIAMKFPNIQSIECYKTSLSIELFRYYATSLQQVSLHSVNFNDREFQLLLTPCPRLTQICLKKIPEITFEGLEAYPSRPQITQLHLTKVGITDKGLQTIARLFTALTSLYLRDCTLLTDAGIAETHFTSTITTFDLSETPIADKAVANILCRIPNIQKLSLYSCQKLPPNSLINSTLPDSITHLVLSHTLTCGKSLKKILTVCKKLRELELSHCEYIDKATFKTFQWPLSVQNLTLKHTLIDEEGLFHLITTAINLQRVDVRECHNLPQEWQVVVTDMDSVRVDYDVVSNTPSELTENLFHLEL